MREIKFRAWDVGAEQMYNWDSIKYQFNEHLEHELVKVMQFTGLHDKNGKEIYEGDIVHMSEYGNNPKKVYWLDMMVKFFLIDKEGGTDHLVDWKARDYLKVIGNIYENPELMEQPK